MGKGEMISYRPSDEKLVRELLDEIDERADRKFSGKKHLSFLDWYLEAEYGERERLCTDAARDGGIDAVLFRDAPDLPAVVVQAKYTDHPGQRVLSGEAYRRFREMLQAFRYPDQFEGWFAGVRGDLRTPYRQLQERLNGLGSWPRKKRVFRLVTLHKASPRHYQSYLADLVAPESVVALDGIVSRYAGYREAAAPPAPQMNLRIRDKLEYRDENRGIISYLFNAQVADFHKYLKTCDVMRLVARNVRYHLGGTIEESIAETYRQSPGDFWYLHNGLTLVCEDFSESQGVATLIKPSVINGAQTLYAISASLYIKDSPALVTVRVICLNGDNRHSSEWLRGITRAVNTQNRVKAYDFRSNEPEQIDLQTMFRRVDVLYERKRGEWKEYKNRPDYRGKKPLRLPVLMQILTVTRDNAGLGVVDAKGRIDDLFGDRNYRLVFGNRSRVKHEFPAIHFKYRLSRVLERVGYTDSRDRRKRQHARWTALCVLYHCLASPESQRIWKRMSPCNAKQAFDRIERDHGNRVAAAWRNRIQAVVDGCWRCWKRAAKEDPERITPNYFFKSRQHNRETINFLVAKHSAAFDRLARRLPALAA